MLRLPEPRLRRDADARGVPRLQHDANRHRTGLDLQRLAAGTRFPDRPYLLNGYPRARFMDEVVFRDGWIVSDPPID